MNNIEMQEKIRQAAEQERTVIYIDSNMIDNTDDTVHNRTNCDLGAIAHNQINRNQGIQIISDKITNLRKIYELIKQYPNIIVIPQVVEELEKGLEWARYIEKGADNDLNFRGSSSRKRRTQSRRKRTLNKDSTEELETLKELSNLLCSTWENFTNLAKLTYGNEHLTEKEKRISSQIVKILCDNTYLSIHNWENDCRLKHGSILQTDETLISYAITKALNDEIRASYLATNDIKQTVRAKGLMETLSPNKKNKLKIICPIDSYKIRYYPIGADRLTGLIQLLNQEKISV